MDTGVCVNVRFGDGSAVDICGRGTVLFTCQDGRQRALTRVYFIPRLRSNIVSLGQLDEVGCRVTIEHGELCVLDTRRQLLAKGQRNGNRLYILHVQPAQPQCMAMRYDDVSWRWHARMGHLNFQALQKLAREEMVRGLPRIAPVDELCDACLAGKQRRAQFPQQAKWRADNLLDLVHGDLCGASSPPTPGGKR